MVSEQKNLLLLSLKDENTAVVLRTLKMQSQFKTFEEFERNVRKLGPFVESPNSVDETASVNQESHKFGKSVHDLEFRGEKLTLFESPNNMLGQGPVQKTDVETILKVLQPYQHLHGAIIIIGPNWKSMERTTKKYFLRLVDFIFGSTISNSVRCIATDEATSKTFAEFQDDSKSLLVLNRENKFVIESKPFDDLMDMQSKSDAEKIEMETIFSKNVQEINGLLKACDVPSDTDTITRNAIYRTMTREVMVYKLFLEKYIEDNEKVLNQLRQKLRKQRNAPILMCETCDGTEFEVHQKTTPFPVIIKDIISQDSGETEGTSAASVMTKKATGSIIKISSGSSGWLIGPSISGLKLKQETFPKRIDTYGEETKDVDREVTFNVTRGKCINAPQSNQTESPADNLCMFCLESAFDKDIQLAKNDLLRIKLISPYLENYKDGNIMLDDLNDYIALVAQDAKVVPNMITNLIMNLKINREN